jgi:hypothetical protein
MLPAFAQAQQKDSISVMHRFITVCSGYRQMPLYLSIHYSASSNIIMSEEDTANLDAEFYNTRAGSYLKFGDLEQLVNDSMALMVSDKMQQMILFPDAKPVLAQMKAAAGISLQDSSIQNMEKRYRAAVTVSSKETETIEINNRTTVYGTDLPRETVTLQYAVQSGEPLQIISVSRRLASADSAAYLIMQQDPAFAGKLLVIEGKGQFVVKETVSKFIYKKISHDAGIKPPASLFERIVKNEEGVYEPAKQWQEYTLSIN